jgi:hypothetical protein
MRSGGIEATVKLFKEDKAAENEVNGDDIND